MSLKVEDLCNIIEDFAPVSLKEDYDNVGLMIGDKGAEVHSILVTLDCTMKVIDEAVENKCNMIVAHHPILFRKPSSITNETLLGRKIIKIIKNNINVYAAHTNLDSIKGGVNDTIVSLLGFNKTEFLFKDNNAVKEAGIGRIIKLTESVTLKELCDIVKTKLKISNLRYAGNEDREIKSIAVINGSGQDFFEEARKAGVDCIITGDTSYHYVSDYAEMNIGIIDAGHFGTEWPAVAVMSEKLKKALNTRGINVPVLVSKNNIDPYRFR